MKLTSDLIIGACRDESSDSGLRIVTELAPIAGNGAPVRAAGYTEGRLQLDKRWIGNEDERRLADIVVIDNVPSQANRLESALKQTLAATGLPSFRLSLEEFDGLPAHFPKALSSFDFPHRQADAYLRDAFMDGQAFGKTQIGQGVFSATADAPEELFGHFPQALLFGFWQSHLGKTRSQAKLARSWVSEIVGVDPATTATRVLGVKGDPLNLSADEAVLWDEYDPESWTFAEGTTATKGAKKAGEKKNALSAIGHGQVPFKAGEEALAAISFGSISQVSTGSIASLRRINCSPTLGDQRAEANASGRALLLCIGLVAHIYAFTRPFSLRSACDLRPVAISATWLGADGDIEVELPTFDESVALLAACGDRAEASGLPVGSKWQREPIELRPSDALAKAIRDTVGGTK